MGWIRVTSVSVGVLAAGVAAVLATRGSVPDPGMLEAAYLAPAASREKSGLLGESDVRYGRDVRPVLANSCFVCHGPDRQTREADLRLDSFAEATAPREGGRPAIVPGDPEASELWRRVTSDDPDYRMPPRESNKRALSEQELAAIRAWIEDGARYEEHWAFVAPQRPAIPATSDASWGRNEIDRFILARLEREGLAPSPEADPETLLRRAFLDLTGLPPTPREVEEFLADERPDRFERWVDRLLGEEPYVTRYAERMTGRWLDQARYADTCGIHMDNGRSIWPWRDWVIEAYRANMPFDRFVVEQLAGDLLPDATQSQRVASGFNRNHITTDEGGVIAEEYLVEYAVDRVSTTGSVFLGLTLGCARCHDHKFDPVSIEEFYSVYAFFNSIEEPGLYSQTADAKRAYEPFMEAPSARQAEAMDQLAAQLDAMLAERDAPNPAEDSQREAFLREVASSAGVAWMTPGSGLEVAGAESLGGATLSVQADGSVLATGENPDTDEQVIRLRTGGEGLRLIALEALPDPSMPYGRVGRAPNGNAVLGAIQAEAVSLADPRQRRPLRFMWAWADVEQENGDFHVENAIDPSPARGWAVGAHFEPEDRPGARVALFLTDEPFGYAGGTEVVVRLDYRTQYAQHSFGRVRISLGTIGEQGLAELPVAPAGFYRIGPFIGTGSESPFAQAFGPEQSAGLDLSGTVGDMRWSFEPGIRDGAAFALSAVVGAEYVANEIFSPSARELELSVGSDDGIRLFVNGQEVYANEVNRPLTADEDKTTITLAPGRNTVIYKIVNTGGPSGIFTRAAESGETLPHAIVGAMLPETARTEQRMARTVEAWRTRFSPHYREMSARIAAQEEAIRTLDAEIPRTMIMKETAVPRETFVLSRGQYDQPDKSRPVGRAIPAALGRLPEDAPKNRLGLAQWIVSDEDPLLARVTVNRLWDMLFGNGIVRTLGDFGLQGEWPTHPELIDWLAVEFRESGWDVRHMLRLMVTSSTYRQAGRVSPDAREIDPENRLLAYFPRQRLAAEQIRDQALYAGGLLVEKVGGPSVKPYQPEGLWQEIAMPNSNTRIYEMGSGEDLWRRSMYTYWKRAAPPPSMLTFDAPTREFCEIKRSSTNTPLQALVLWNDVQFVEAARGVAARVLAGAEDDPRRLALLYLLCAGRPLDQARREALGAALADFRARFEGSRADAEKLIELGESPVPEGVRSEELAAWTMLASAVMSSDATIVKN
ncbi:MAG TPA: PSD1 and planctomycete cytochrome C domain-containing protein [Phycisphaerales bacterium]|nr:PSD1 and planctomycete cytochrome C domain-containing protein [Phycisphaerales bacterium]